MPTMDTSYLTTQVTTIIGQLHGLFDDIGVPSHERESREAEVSKSGIQESMTNAFAAFQCLVGDIAQPSSHCNSVNRINQNCRRVVVADSF